MAAAFDTSAVPADERFAFYREVVLGSLYRMTAEVKDTPEAFHSTIVPHAIGGALAVQCQGTPHTVSRTRHDIAASDSGCYFVFQQLGPSRAIFQGGGSDGVELAAGSLVLGDADTPFTTPEFERYNHVFWMLPKALIDPILPGAAARLARPVALAGGGLCALLSAYLQTLRAQAGHPDIAANGAVAAHLGQLIALALGAGETGEPRRAALADMRHRQALALIERHYREPALSAAEVAARLGISVRTLHAAFEPSGTSFAEALGLRRLQASRCALANPAARHRSIAAIAFACGFNDVSTFHRAFRRAYGITPSDLRP